MPSSWLSLAASRSFPWALRATAFLRRGLVKELSMRRLLSQSWGGGTRLDHYLDTEVELPHAVVAGGPVGENLGTARPCLQSCGVVLDSTSILALLEAEKKRV